MKEKVIIVAIVLTCMLGLGSAFYDAPHKEPASTSLVVSPSTVGTPIAPNTDAPVIEGRPLTAVVVTQCSNLVAVYLTWPAGYLTRIDQTNGIPWDEALNIANSAGISERIEISCQGTGAEGHERHSTNVNL